MVDGSKAGAFLILGFTAPRDRAGHGAVASGRLVCKNFTHLVGLSASTGLILRTLCCAAALPNDLIPMIPDY
jgi:hypothetical protein